MGSASSNSSSSRTSSNNNNINNNLPHQQRQTKIAPTRETETTPAPRRRHRRRRRPDSETERRQRHRRPLAPRPQPNKKLPRRRRRRKQTRVFFYPPPQPRPTAWPNPLPKRAIGRTPTQQPKPPNNKTNQHRPLRKPHRLASGPIRRAPALIRPECSQRELAPCCSLRPRNQITISEPQARANRPQRRRLVPALPTVGRISRQWQNEVLPLVGCRVKRAPIKHSRPRQLAAAAPPTINWPVKHNINNKHRHRRPTRARLMQTKR